MCLVTSLTNGAPYHVLASVDDAEGEVEVAREVALAALSAVLVVECGEAGELRGRRAVQGRGGRLALVNARSFDAEDATRSQDYS